MLSRPLWLKLVEQAWQKRSILWLSGVRRVGKTSLAKMLPAAQCLNCDLPSVARQLEDPEYFFAKQPQHSQIILDEIHRLPDPSRILKIAADEFKHLRILATGSSTLDATQKFRDSLTGRKTTLYLCPVLWDECQTDFHVTDLDRRLLHGGLPEPLLSKTMPADFYAEWIDSFYARDISELFSVRQRSGFLKLFKLLLFQSGGMLDISKLASETELSRPTVLSYIETMTIAHAITPILPFHGKGRREIVHNPKVYGFDTGFVSYVRGWNELRDEDRGILWEHLVLDTLRMNKPHAEIRYWRDKSQRELDFVVAGPQQQVDVIECKINPDRFEPAALMAFRTLYPKGKNWVIAPTVINPYHRKFNGLEVHIASSKVFFQKP